MSDRTPSLPPAAAFSCAAGSWAASLAVAAHAGGPYLAASIAGWTTVHLLATALFRRLKGDFQIGGYPAWSFMESFLHGGVILPTLFFLSLWLLPSERWDATTFLLAPWDAGIYMAPLSQCHAAILAYMLKDFYLYDAIEVGYAVHHVVATFGCLICLVMPMAAGLNTFNAIQCAAALPVRAAAKSASVDTRSRRAAGARAAPQRFYKTHGTSPHTPPPPFL